MTYRVHFIDGALDGRRMEREGLPYEIRIPVLPGRPFMVAARLCGREGCPICDTPENRARIASTDFEEAVYRYSGETPSGTHLYVCDPDPAETQRRIDRLTEVFKRPFGQAD